MKRITVGIAAAVLATAAVGYGAQNVGALPTTTGSWSVDAPSTVVTATADVYTAQIQQPINADGSSVWPAKKGVVPVQFKVTKATQTTTTTTYLFESLANATDHTAWSWIGFTPSGTLTIGDLTNLTANFAWLTGYNHGGGFRWQIGTPSGNIMVDYGDTATSLQSGTAGTGVNMTTLTDNRVESDQVGNALPMYDSWQHVQATYGSLAVNYVALVVDGGWGGDQALNVTSVSVNDNTVTNPLTPAPVISGTTTPVQTNVDPATLHLVRTSGTGTLGTIDESLVTSAQADTGGHFRQVDGKYIYNLDVSGLGQGSYQAFIQFNSTDVQTPGVFGLK